MCQQPRVLAQWPSTSGPGPSTSQKVRMEGPTGHCDPQLPCWRNSFMCVHREAVMPLTCRARHPHRALGPVTVTFQSKRDCRCGEMESLGLGITLQYRGCSLQNRGQRARFRGRGGGDGRRGRRRCLLRAGGHQHRTQAPWKPGGRVQTARQHGPAAPHVRPARLPALPLRNSRGDVTGVCVASRQGWARHSGSGTNARVSVNSVFWGKQFFPQKISENKSSELRFSADLTCGLMEVSLIPASAPAVRGL